jgi:hypothetical protein
MLFTIDFWEQKKMTTATIANYLAPANSADVIKNAAIMRDWIAYGLYKLNDGIDHQVSIAVWFTDFASAQVSGTMHKVSQESSTYWANGTTPAASLFANDTFDFGNDGLRNTMLMAYTANLAITYLANDPDRGNRVLRVEFQHTKSGQTWNHEFSASWNQKNNRFTVIYEGATKIAG